MTGDAAVRAAMEAQTGHSLRAVGLPHNCACGESFAHFWEYEQHVTAIAVEAARPIIEAEALTEAADDLPQKYAAVAAWLRVGAETAKPRHDDRGPQRLATLPEHTKHSAVRTEPNQ